jgi:phosphoribulokinase
VARSIVVGIVGDSGAGKTTVTRGLTRVLGDAHVTHISADDYHRFDRRRRAEVGLTPLNPDCNHLDILTQHLIHLRRGEAVLKPVYDHRNGSFQPPEYVRPGTFLVVEGLLNFHTETLRSVHDVLVALAPPEELRRAWKLKRDLTRRGYTTDEVLAELDRRQRDAEAYVHPQRAHADIVVSFVPGASGDPKHLDADVILRDTLPHPDLGPLIEGAGHGPALIKREREWLLRIPGDLDPGHAAEIEEAVWERMSFANHLRIRRLGEFTVGTDLLRSDSLALVQLLILYHAVTARAALAIGGSPPRAEPRDATGADSALHT